MYQKTESGDVPTASARWSLQLFETSVSCGSAAGRAQKSRVFTHPPAPHSVVVPSQKVEGLPSSGPLSTTTTRPAAAASVILQDADGVAPTPQPVTGLHPVIPKSAQPPDA